MYLERRGASKVAAGCRCAAGGQPLKDLEKVIHYHVHLFLEGLLDQYFDRIYCSLISLFFFHGKLSWFVRLILQGFNQIEPQLLYPDLVGDVKIKIEKEKTDLIPLIRIYAGMQ